MIVTSTVGKIDALIGRFEGPILAYMEKEETDYAKNSLKKVLYNVKNSKHYSESVAGMTGIGDFVATDGAIPYDEFEEGYSKTFVHQVFKKGVEIKRETIDDARIIDMENKGGELTESWNRTQEEFVHAVFNNPTSATYTLAGKSFTNVGQDGLALGHAAHTSKTGKGINQSNLTAYELTVPNLKLVEEMAKNFKNDIGQKGNIKIDTLFVPYELRNTAYEIAYSLQKVNSADNNVNPYKDKFQIIVSDWLTDANDWYALDSRYMKKCLYWIDRVPLEIKSNKDFNTGNWQLGGYSRMICGFTDWRWCVVNKPA